MQYFSALRFRRRMARLLFSFGIGIQLLAGIAEYIYLYQTAGGSVSAPALHMTVLTILDIMRSVSLFSCYGMMIFFVFIYGLKGGGEMLLSEAAAIGLYLFLSRYLYSFVFGIIGILVILTVELCVFSLWWRGEKYQLCLLFSSVLLPVLSALSSLFGTNQSLVTSDMVGATVLLNLTDRAVNLLLFSLVARIAALFRKRAIEAGNGIADLSVGSCFSFGHSPFGRAMISSSCVYAVFVFVSSVVGNFQIEEEPSSAGSLSFSSIMMMALVSIGYLVLSYIVMWFFAFLTETMFIRSEDEQQAKTG